MKKIILFTLSLFLFSATFSFAEYSQEYQDAYKYAYDNWITTINSIDNADLDWSLTRIAMAKMVSNFAINVAKIQPDRTLECKFNDVSQKLDEQYWMWVTLACQLWLMWIDESWSISKTFNPNTFVTRAQWWTVFSRLINKIQWTNINNWSPYYLPHLNYLYNSEIIKSIDNPTPDSTEKRWNVMLMIKRYSDIFEEFDIDFSKNSDEAHNIFWIAWTPWNAIIDMKTKNFKVIWWAYPQENFEWVIAQIKSWENLVTDEMWNAWTLTQEELDSVLKNVYFKNDNKKADIVIVEYSDLLCPYCKRHYFDRTIENIIEADNSITLVFKNMPIEILHPNAPFGARGAECAWKIGWFDAYYKFLDAAFWETDFSDKNILEIAKKLNLNELKFKSCYESYKYVY